MLAFSEKRTYKTCPSLSPPPWTHWRGGCSGTEGGKRAGCRSLLLAVASSYPFTSSRNVLSSIYKQILFLLQPDPEVPPWRDSPSHLMLGGSPAQEGLCWLLPMKRFPLSHQCLEKAGVALGAVWSGRILFGFSFYFESPFSLSLLASLSLLSVYNNYTETATNLYIVFGSNSMRREGIIKIWDSYSPLLCKFKSGGWGKGIVKMFTKL